MLLWLNLTSGIWEEKWENKREKTSLMDLLTKNSSYWSMIFFSHALFLFSKCWRWQELCQLEFLNNWGGGPSADLFTDPTLLQGLSRGAWWWENHLSAGDIKFRFGPWAGKLHRRRAWQHTFQYSAWRIPWNSMGLPLESRVNSQFIESQEIALTEATEHTHTESCSVANPFSLYYDGRIIYLGGEFVTTTRLP